MNKNIVYSNILQVFNDVFYDKYCQIANNNGISISDDISVDKINKLEEISAGVFNAILIGSQIFDDQESIKEFVDKFATFISPYGVNMFLEQKGVDIKDACERLNHGFAVHFTTPNICQEIINNHGLSKSGKNAMFTKEEDELIKNATEIQLNNDPNAEKMMNYLFRGWGTGVSSYGSITNGFWMYHTPESLSFLFGNISFRDKELAMNHVLNCISSLDDESKKKVFSTLNEIYDRLVGTKQEVGCILIDRDALEYEVDYYYNTGEPVAVERRPFNHGLDGLNFNDNQINTDIDINKLRFMNIPTVYELEQIRKERSFQK